MCTLETIKYYNGIPALTPLFKLKKITTKLTKNIFKLFLFSTATATTTQLPQSLTPNDFNDSQHSNHTIYNFSSLFRFLVFYSQDVMYNEHYDATKSQVEVRIDNTVLCDNAQRKGPLHTCPWSPSLYDKGTHSLVVHIIEVCV